MRQAVEEYASMAQNEAKSSDLNCSDAIVLYRNPVFWLEKNLEVVLSLGVILAHIFLFYLLKSDQKLPRGLRWILMLNSILSASLGTYLLAKSVYTFLAFLLSECPLLSTLKSCRVQETLVLFVYTFIASAPVLLGLERVVSHWILLRPPRPNTPNERSALTNQQTHRSPLQTSFGSFLLLLISFALPGCFVTVLFVLGSKPNWNRRKPDQILLLQCNVLSTLPNPLPLCCSITLVLFCLLTAAIWGWALTLSRKTPISEDQQRRFHFDSKITQELITSIMAQTVIMGIALILYAIIHLVWTLGRLEQLVVLRILFEEMAFYFLPIVNCFLFAVTVSWKLSPIRSSLLRLLPCLKGVVRQENSTKDGPDLPQSSIHSLPDNLSLSDGDEMTLIITETSPPPPVQINSTSAIISEI